MANSHSSPVIVNVYDMSSLNEYISNIGLGVYHTGVEVYEREYCYGGHQFGGSGIFEMVPRDTENLGPNYTFKTSIIIGCTDFTYRDVCTILNTMEKEFLGDQYHLLRKNCNHFSSAFVEILCGATLPKWINRLASVSTKLPFIEKSIPKEWLTPLQQSDEEVTRSRANNQPHPLISRRSTTGSMFSLPPTPNRTSSSQTTTSTTSPGEQWRRFQMQVSNYFSRTSNGATNGTGGSSSTSMSTPPTEKSSRRRPS
ncbi:unnamed protein product [Hymenolepis diminuta]|uniref:DUF862 domain-containing protein n=1 Tax=Hymenolepis diminuta TaxID=6216 RepID=A0A158QDF3_HYMDI|nr:unnamed protein product [Hymenolepis diminuta]